MVLITKKPVEKPVLPFKHIYSLSLEYSGQKYKAGNVTYTIRPLHLDCKFSLERITYF